MPRYPISWAQEVAELYIHDHPRGWGWTSQNFYIRDEDLPKIIANDQYLWNKLKAMVRRLEHAPSGCSNFEVPGPVLARLTKEIPEIRSFWHAFSSWSGFPKTDFMDCLTYVNRKPAPTLPLHQHSLF